MGGLKTLLCLLAVVISWVQAGYVEDVYPTRGSMAGGTRLTISGSGFARDQFNFLDTPNVGNEVQLVTRTSSYVCDIHKDGSNLNQIMCYTSKMPAGDYFVRVTVDGQAFSDEEYPDGDRWSDKCSFQVRDSHTPIINTVSPRTAIPEQTIRLDGKLFSDLYGTNVDFSSNGRPERMRRANIGSDKFDVIDPTNEDKPDLRDEFYGYEVEEDSDDGYMIGKNTGTYVGNSNISFILDGYFGRSMFRSYALTANMKLTMYQTYAVIYSVSPSTGSTKGKTRLSIVGKYFDETDADAVVMVAGTPCSVHSVQDELIVCSTDEEPLALPSDLLGNRGMTLDVWTGSTQYDDDLANSSSFPAADETEWMDGAQFLELNDTRDDYVVRFSGYFLPPADGDYKLMIKGSDEGVLLFNDGSSTSQVGSFDSEKTGYWGDAGQGSSKLNLTANTPYYLEAKGKMGAGLSSLQVGAFLYNTVYTSSHTSNAYDEIQEVELTSDIILEQQTIAFSNFVTQTPTIGVQSLEIESAGLLGGAPFRITLDGVSTTKLTIDSSDSDVADAIGQLPNVFPATVSVSKSVTATGVTYSAEFSSTKGAWPDLSADVSSDDATVTTTTTIPGVPELSSYYLHFDGSMTGAIDLDASAEDVKSALLAAKGVRCPPWLIDPASKFLKTDFESPMAPMQWAPMTSEIMPFCGSKSIKNTEFLFYDQWNAPSAPRLMASTARYVCFAFNGEYYDRIRLHYNYTYDGEQHRRHTDLWFSEDIVGEYGVWKYRCIDMYQAILDFHASNPVSNVLIWYIRVFPVNKLQDSFIDTVYIGSTELVPSDEVEDLGKMTLKPTSWNVEDIEVTGDFASSFTVTVTARDCASNFPFIKVHGGTATESGSTSVLSSSDWPADAEVTVTRVTAASPAVGGTFSLAYDGDTVQGLRAGMTAESFKAKLESMSSMGGGLEVEFSGGCSACKWKVRWMTEPGDHPEITVDDISTLTGENVAVSVTTTQDGGIMLDPIPGDMLRTKHTAPQVSVVINNIPSLCDGTCQFEWSSSATPTFTAVNPTSGAAGITVTLTGTGFSTTAAENVITIGDTECVTSTSTATQLECTLGQGQAGTHDVNLNILTKGEADKSGATLQFSSTFAVTSISPSTGALGGGTSLTLTGTGFGDGVKVTVGGNACDVVSAAYDTIVCLTPAGTAGAVDVVATEGSNTHTSPTQFTYDASVTPVVSSISPDSVGLVQGGKVITITGSSFGTSPSVNVPVRIRGEPAPHSSYSDTEIVVTLPALPPGAYPLLVSTAVGNATLSGISDITYTLEVTNVYPTSGSLDGGTDITITGSGFSSDNDDNIIHFGNSRCEVSSSTSSQVVCRSGTVGNTHVVNNLGVHAEYYIGYEWNPKQITVQVGDSVRWEWTTAQYVEGVAYGVYQTEEADSSEQMEDGFSSGSSNTPRGSYTNTFMTPGTYFYFSKALDANSLVIMRGKVTVTTRSSSVSALNFTIAGSEADYNTASGVSDPSNSDSCAPATTAITGCSDAEPTSSDSTKFYFSYWSCKTPSISEIEPLSGTASTVITITGTGFSTTSCQNEVMIGFNPCTIISATETELTCSISPLNDALVGTLEKINMRVKNLGSGLSTALGGSTSYFLYMPHITTVTPSAGSIAGGTRVTISGKGFRTGHTQVLIDGVVCDILSQDYSTIECSTPTGADGTTADVAVLVHNEVQDVPATCEDSSSSCQFNYQTQLTPTVASVTNIPITVAGQTITITGTNFGTTSDTTIYIGDTPCTVTTVDASTIECDAGTPIVGSQVLSVHKSPDGLASSSVAFVSVDASALTVSPSSGSLGGGTQLTVTGLGFLDGETEVTVDGNECDLDSVSPTQIVCETPSKSSAGSVDLVVISNGVTFPAGAFAYDNSMTPTVTSVSPSSGNSGDTMTLTGSGFGTTAGDVSVSVFGVSCSVSAVTDTSVTCALGSHSAGASQLVVTVDNKGLAQPTVDFTYDLTVSSVSPNLGSFGGGQEVTITGNGFEAGSTSVTICSEPCEVDNVTPDQIVCHSPANSGSGVLACTVSVTTPGDSTDQLNSYEYNDSFTPEITGVNPDVGGTGGGTMITISGSGFGTASADVDVKVGGVGCDVSTVVADQVVCTTNARTASGPAPIELSVGTNGLAKSTVNFNYKNSWSSAASWGGVKPMEGSFVVITSDMTVYLDEDTPLLAMLLIQGGALIFEEMDVELKAKNILITDGGLLQVGTEDNPFQHRAIISMYGHSREPELPIYGAKTLAVREGTLDLHGKFHDVMWTVLDATANAGSNTLTLKHPVDWEVGNKIAIASTGNFLSQGENEQHTIAAISGDGRTLTLEDPLAFTHLGEPMTYRDETLEARAEVGLLSHNVLFKGSDDPAWHDEIPACEEGFNPGEFTTQTCFQGRFGAETEDNGYGGQIMAHAPIGGKALIRISGTELTYVGQEFRLGRYAIHFHLNGDMSDSYVKRTSIHNSHNRAVNIHGSHNIRIEHNVIYNIRGGAFFLEDGVEVGNVFEYNLAIFVIASTSLQNDDITPAAFWATNPNNTYQHNHAAGGTHFGFWYRMHEHPDGPSFDPNICPRKVPLGLFYNNTVHSQGWFGIWIFKMYHPTATGECDSTDWQAARFKSLTAWNCEKGAEWVGAGAVQFWDSRFFSNAVAGFEGKLIQAGDRYSEDSGPMLKNTVIAAKPDSSSQTTAMGSTVTSRALILPYGSGLIIRGTKFINFDQADSACIGVTSVQGTTEDDNGAFTYHMDLCEFSNSPNKAFWRWLHEAVLYDLDGTCTGVVNGKALPLSGILPSTCVENAEFSLGVAGAICPADTNFVRFSFNEAKPSSLNGKNISMTNSHGSTYGKFRAKRVSHKEGWSVILLAGQTYNFAFDNGEQLTNISYHGSFLELVPDQYLIMQHNFTQVPDRIFTRAGDSETREPKSVRVNYEDDTDGAVSLEGTLLSMMVSDKDTTSSRRKRDVSTMKDRETKFNAFHCERKGCIEALPPGTADPSGERPDDFKLWSDVSTWAGTDPNGDGTPGLPIAGNNVTINKDDWVVMDISPPDLSQVFIYGTLEFDPRDDSGSYLTLKLSATHVIIIGGRLIVGTEDEPFPGDATIELRGNKLTRALAMENGPAVGAMALGNFGGLDMHGKGEKSWTKLGQTASEGSSELTLSSSVDWLPGDDVIVTTTDFDYTHNEVRTIDSVSGDGLTLTLTSPLDFDHEVSTTSTGGGMSFTLAAEVGRLSRNVRIVGKSYPSMTSDAFGGRVLVGSYFSFDESTGTGTQNTGFARIKGVEFHQTGQEGFTDAYDPRFSLAFLNSGTVVPERPSYVKHCAFHHGFATAIGVFGAGGIPIVDNVVYRTLSGGFVIEGEDVEMMYNLVTSTLVPGLWNGRTEDDEYWDASYELVKAVRPVLVGNVAAGSERTGFHVKGERCQDDSLSSGNEAHSLLIGVEIMPDDAGVPGCALFNGYTVWKAFDVGMYLQTSASLEVTNYTSIQNNLGLYPMVIGPSAVSHAFEDRTIKVSQSRFVGFGGLSCDDTMPSDLNMELSEKSRSYRTVSDGGVGLALGTFASSTNNAPTHPFVNLMSYPATRGQTIIDDVHFVNFGQNCDQEQDVAITTMPRNDDGIHPTVASDLHFEDTPMLNRFYIFRPRVGTINPSDCVDMDCDGLKKVIFHDTDGSMTGRPAHLLSESEWEWDGDPRRGLGDYRIPKAMLTNLDGSRIDVDDIIPNKGIARDPTCTLQGDWNAWKCHVYDYMMLMLESMDADTETRRVSPIGVRTGTYIDLVNGPQDHGWCMGYTCQKRISNFPIVLPMGQTSEIYFTGTSPQSLRFHLLNAENSQAFLAAVYYKIRQRIDIYVDGIYLPPLNVGYNSKNQQILNEPTSAGQYIPDVTNHPNGANYFDRDSGLLYIMVRGDTFVETKMAPVIIVTFQMPAMTIDDFFGENIISNLANFLNIPPEKIIISKAIRETRTSGRRRRSTEVTTVEVQILNQPSSDGSSDASDLTYEILQEKSSQLINAAALNILSTVLQVEILGFSIEEPVPDPSSSEWEELAITLANGTTTSSDDVPVLHSLAIESHPTVVYEGLPFEANIHFLDANGNHIETVGAPLTVWQMNAALHSGSTFFNGTTRRDFGSNGYARFDDLAISQPGIYYINYTLFAPEYAVPLFSGLSKAVHVKLRPFKAMLTHQPRSITVGEMFDLRAFVHDDVTDRKVTNLTWKYPNWTCNLTLLNPVTPFGNVTLSGNVKVNASNLGGDVSFGGLILSLPGQHVVRLTYQSEYGFYNFSTNVVIKVQPADIPTHTAEVSKRVTLKLIGDYSATVTGREDEFHSAVYNSLQPRDWNILWADFESYEGSIVVSSSVNGTNDDVTNALSKLNDDVSGKKFYVMFNGVKFLSDGTMRVDNEPYGAKSGLNTGEIAAIVCCCVLVCAIAILLLICLIKKSDKSGQGSHDNWRSVTPMSARSGKESRIGGLVISDMEIEISSTKRGSLMTEDGSDSGMGSHIGEKELYTPELPQELQYTLLGAWGDKPGQRTPRTPRSAASSRATPLPPATPPPVPVTSRAVQNAADAAKKLRRRSITGSNGSNDDKQ